jgi:hypothetical protein
VSILKRDPSIVKLEEEEVIKELLNDKYSRLFE